MYINTPIKYQWVCIVVQYVQSSKRLCIILSFINSSNTSIRGLPASLALSVDLCNLCLYHASSNLTIRYPTPQRIYSIPHGSVPRNIFFPRFGRHSKQLAHFWRANDSCVFACESSVSRVFSLRVRDSLIGPKSTVYVRWTADRK
jgi:hypothetical protein